MGVYDYAKEKGVEISSLSKEELKQFLTQERQEERQKVIFPASNEPSGHACMHIWRLPRGL